jgi:pimeloyl-ACP methyl ester carboxylesterase
VPTVAANGIELEYESRGEESAPAILMIMGLGGQLIRWPVKFCEALLAAGYRLVVFDNRDIGLSTKMSGRVSVVSAALRNAVGLPSQLPYTLEDMALDARGLLDALGIARAHVIGVSMGGMIGQLLTARFGERVGGFVSMMSTSGSLRLPGPSWDLRLSLLKRTASVDRAVRIERMFRVLRRIASPAYPPDEAVLRSLVARELDRADHPAGFLRQLAAIVGTPSRLQVLTQIRNPTLILHGESDPLVPVAAAYDLQRRIPGAELQTFPGMGHDLPVALLPTLTARIIAHLRRVEGVA